MAKQKEIRHIPQLLQRGLRSEPVKTYGDLVRTLEKLKVKPGEAFRIINDHKQKSQDGNIRFNWKMIRFTLFIWERLEEDRRGYLKPKIDTVRAVVQSNPFKHFFYGYFPDLKLIHEEEERKLNKLIAEKPQQQYFKEGYYYYKNEKKLIPQKHLDHILLAKK